MKRRMMKQAVSIALTCAVLLTSLPISAAANPVEVAEQEKTETEEPSVTISMGEIVWENQEFPKEPEISVISGEEEDSAMVENQTIMEESDVCLDEEERIQNNIALKKQMEEDGELAVESSSSAFIENTWLEVAVASNGRFTIGTNEGNENYTSDNNQNLLYGHASPGTSDTLLSVDGSTTFFEAEQVYKTEDGQVVYATMMYQGVLFTQILSFMKNGSSNKDDTVKISYEAVNQSGESKSVGIRIMMDTMLASNDYAPFKITGIGNVTTRREFSGESIPSSYQVYDDLDNPTTLANGTVFLPGQRKPDIVQFTNWGSIHGDRDWYNAVDTDFDLGDSAVAFYYNPVSLLPGEGTTVSTYYGTGLGVTDSEGGVINTDKISNKDFGIYLLDSRTMKPIPSATVTLESDSWKSDELVTDANGKVVFRNVESYNHKEGTLAISHADYTNNENKTKAVIINCGYYDSIFLKSADDTSPEILSAKLTSNVPEYNQVDLLKNNIHINANSTEIKVTNSNVEKLTLTIQSDADDAVYQLIVDNEVVQTSDTGIFTLNAIKKDNKGKNFSTLRLDQFSEGKKIYARVVSKEGVDSATKLLGIKVSKPSTASTNILQDFKMSNELSLGYGEGDASSLNTILNLFFGQKNVKVSPILSKVKLTVDEGGKVQVAIKGTPDALSLETPDDWKNFRSEYEMAVRTARRTKKAYTDHTKAKGFGYGNLSANIYFCGYGEGNISDATDGDGKFTVNVGFIVGVKGSASHTHQFFLGYVPVYITGGLNVDGQFNGEAALTFGNQFNARFSKGEFTLTPELYIEGGVGASGVLSLGAKGDGKVEHLHDCLNDYDKVDLTAAASVEVHLLLYSNSIEIASKTWNLYDSNKLDSDTIAAETESIGSPYDLSGFKLTDRSYQNLDRTADISAEKLATGMSVNSNVYTAAQPKMVKTADGTLYRFWLADDSERDDYNRTELVFSYYKDDDEEWTEPKAIDGTDNTADLAFDVDVDGNVVYVIWQNATKQFTKEEIADAQTGVAVIVENSAASVAKVTEGTVSIVSNAINNKKSVLQPRITVEDGKLYTAWYNNTNHTLVADETTESDQIGQTEIFQTAYDLSTETWGTTDKTTVGAYVLTSYDLGCLDGKATIAYVLDTDNNLNTSDDRELYLISGTDNTKIVDKETNNAALDESPLFAKADDKTTLFWYANGNVFKTSTTVADAKAVLAEAYAEQMPNSAFAVMEGTGAKLAWFDRSATGEGQNAIFIADIAEEASIPYEWAVLDEQDPMLSDLSGVVKEGKVIASYAQKTFIEEDEKFDLFSSDLCVCRNVEESTAIALTNVICDENALTMGSEAGEVTLTLQNLGNTVIDKIEVVFGESRTTETGLNLQPGESKEYTFENIKVPELEQADLVDLYVVVTDASENELETESYQVGVGYTDIEVVQQDSVILGNKEYLSFAVQNNSAVPAENVNLKLMDNESMDGTVLFDYDFGEIKPEEVYQVFCPVDSISTDVAYQRLTTSTQEDAIENNAGLVCVEVGRPELLKTSAFAIASGSNEAGSIIGTYEASYETNQIIPIEAQVNEGFAFNGWKLDGDGTIEDDEETKTNFVMGNADVSLTAEFVTKNPMTGITVPSELSMEVGQTQTLDVTKTPTDASGFLDYVSSDPEVVSVERKGKLTALKEGTAVITVSSRDDSTVKTTCTITVTGINVTNIRMTYPSRTLVGNGTSEKLNYIVTPSNATEELKWSSSNDHFVTVSQDGTITAKANGTATIRCENTDGTIFGETVVTVINPLTGLVASRPAVLLNKGASTSVSVSPVPSYTSDSIQDVTWSSTNTNVVTVTANEEDPTSAILTGVNGGSARITASVGTVSTSFSVNVTSPITAITLSNTAISIREGKYQYLDYYATPNDYTDDVNWYSSNTAVATVSSSGEVYGKAPGTAIITVESDGGVKATCTVTVLSSTITVNSTEEMQSSHPYENGTTQKWVYTKPGASSITFVFTGECDLEEDCDYLYIYDKNGKQVGKYTGNSLQNKTITVAGDTVTFKLVTDSSVTSYGFALQSITANMPSDTPPTNTPPTNTPKPKPAVVTLNAKKTVLQVKKSTSALRANVSAGDKVVSWSSSNKKVATVSKKGVIKAKKVGKTIITVKTKKGAKASCELTVQKKPVTLKKLIVGKSSIQLKKGKTYTLRVSKDPITYAKKLTYKSSNKKIATVSSKGVIKAKKKGKCTITIKCGTKSKKVKVTVK